MRGRKVVLVPLALAAAALLATLGATTAAGRDQGTRPIIIGAAVDLTGQMSPFDAPALRAARLQAAKINRRGGVLGRRLEIRECNHQLNAARGKSCAQRLLRQGAVVMLVTCDVEYAAPAAQESLRAGRLTIAPCIGTDQMGPKRFGSRGRLAFSLGNVAQDEGAAMAEFAIKKGWRRAITVQDNLLVYFRNVVRAFTVRYRQLGGRVVLAESFTNGDKTIGTVAGRVARTNAQVIVTSTTFGDWPAFMSGVRSLRNRTPIMNSWAGDGTYWYPRNPRVTNYWYVTFASAFGDDPSREVRSLIQQMKRTGLTPGTGGFVTGAATVDAIAAAIRQSKSTNGTKLANRFLRFKRLPTVSGRISFSRSFHTVFGRAYRVMRVENNRPRFVTLETAARPVRIG